MTNLFKVLVHLRALASHYVSEVWSENKWRSLALDAKFLLEIAQKMTEINVEQVARSRDLNAE